MMVDTKESKVMDIKINDIQTSSSVQQVKNTESTDSSFKFTLISNIEEKDLQEKLGRRIPFNNSSLTGHYIIRLYKK